MQHTVKQMMPAIGASVLVRFESIQAVCMVRDAKNSWGKVRILIAPVNGGGEQWIELDRLVLTASAVEMSRAKCACSVCNPFVAEVS